MWPEFKIVHGKSKHSQSQCSAEKANKDVENILKHGCKQKKLPSGVKD